MYKIPEKLYLCAGAHQNGVNLGRIHMDPILDVTIGLVFLYLLLALIVTVITDAMAGLLRLRARNLNKSLEALLKSDEADTLATVFHETGTMQTIRLMSGQFFLRFPIAIRKWIPLISKNAHGEKYTKVESESFVNALLEAGKTSMAKANTISEKDGGEVKPVPTLITNAAELIEIIEALPDSNLKKSILTVIDDVKYDVKAVKALIAEWFDTMMETASTRFRVAMKQYAFVCALLVTVVANADTIKIAGALWNDDTMRIQISENAAAFVADAETVDELADFEIVQAELRPFPIGWDTTSPYHDSDWYFSTDGWIKKLVGWFLTALAVSLGAPFWFDLLKKLAALKKTGAAAAQPNNKKPGTAQ